MGRSTTSSQRLATADGPSIESATASTKKVEPRLVRNGTIAAVVVHGGGPVRGGSSLEHDTAGSYSDSRTKCSGRQFLRRGTLHQKSPERSSMLPSDPGVVECQ